MKRILKTGVILVAIFMITGCVKMEVSMGINKDKSMDLKILQAVDKSLMEGDESDFDMSNLKEAENQGFLVKEYSKDNMQGYTLTIKFENIDDLSTEENNYVSDFGLILEKSDISLFSIKKGFLKNTYTAKLDISNNSMGDDFSSMIGNDSNINDDFSIDNDDSYEDDWSYTDEDFSSDMDYTQMMSNMEMNFVVNLPYKAINSNATSIDNHGKQLTWNLLTHQNQTIDFEFELYNMKNVYIVVGAILAVIILIIVIIIKKIGNGKSSGSTTIMTNSGSRQNSYITTPTDTNNNNNNFMSSNSSFNDVNDSNSFVTPSSSVDFVGTFNNMSSNTFFNPQSVEVNKSEQTNAVSPINVTPDTSLNQLNQIHSMDSNNSFVNDESNLNNDTNSILTNLDSLKYNAAPIDNVSTNSIMSESIAQNQSVEQSITPSSVISNQNLEVDSNKFFQNPNNL